MSDVLSQSEIDNLLAALSSGEVDAEEMKKEGEKQSVKDYDFARPSKFSKEHLRTLEIIFEHYGRLLSTNLPVFLRKNIQVEVMNSEAVTYMEFSNALSNPVLLGIVDFAPYITSGGQTNYLGSYSSEITGIRITFATVIYIIIVLFFIFSIHKRKTTLFFFWFFHNFFPFFKIIIYIIISSKIWFDKI